MEHKSVVKTGCRAPCIYAKFLSVETKNICAQSDLICNVDECPMCFGFVYLLELFIFPQTFEHNAIRCANLNFNLLHGVVKSVMITMKNILVYECVCACNQNDRNIVWVCTACIVDDIKHMYITHRHTHLYQVNCYTIVMIQQKTAQHTHREIELFSLLLPHTTVHAIAFTVHFALYLFIILLFCSRWIRFWQSNWIDKSLVATLSYRSVLEF